MFLETSWTPQELKRNVSSSGRFNHNATLFLVQGAEIEMWLKKRVAEKGFVEIHLVSGDTLESGFRYFQDLTLFFKKTRRSIKQLE